jgi:hypothetical protein
MQVFREFSGHQTLGEAFDLQMQQNAKVAANTMLLGVKPDKAFAVIKNAVEREFQGTVDRSELHSALNKAHSAYLNVTAPPATPTTTTDKMVNLVRGLMAFSKLGSSIFAATWDLNSTALQYAVHTGESMFKAYGKTFVEFAKTLEKAGRGTLREFGEDVGVNLHFNDPAIAFGGNVGDYDTGFDAVNRFFHRASYFTGVPHQTISSRGTGGSMMSQAFQKMLNNVDNLNKFQMLALEEYNLSIDDLRLIRDNTNPDGDWGFITSKNVREIDLAKFDAGSTSAAMKKRQELWAKYNAYIDAAVQYGTPTPTAQTRRHLGKAADNPYRALFSLIMQFKETAWKIGMGNKKALERYYAASGAKGTSIALAEYTALAGASYFAIEYTKAALFNQRTPGERWADGERREVAFDFVNKASFIPVISDAVDQGTSPYYGNNIVNYLAGPTGGMAIDAFNVGKSLASDRQGATTKAAWKFARRNVLPSNWVPAKAAVKHLFEYDMITGEKIRTK